MRGGVGLARPPGCSDEGVDQKPSRCRRAIRWSGSRMATDHLPIPSISRLTVQAGLSLESYAHSVATLAPIRTTTVHMLWSCICVSPRLFLFVLWTGFEPPLLMVKVYGSNTFGSKHCLLTRRAKHEGVGSGQGVLPLDGARSPMLFTESTRLSKYPASR